MARYGQISVYGGYAPKEYFDIIDTEDYKLRVTKTAVVATGEWHLKFTSLGILEQSWECFLTTEQLAQLKRVL